MQVSCMQDFEVEECRFINKPLIIKAMENNMHFKESLLLGLGLALALAGATSAQAETVTSMTIVEIGYTGVGTSAAGTGAGIFYFGNEAGNGVVAAGGKNFNSTGTTDGMITMGTAQGNGAFATPFVYGGANPAVFNFNANTQGGVTVPPTGPTGDITGSTFTLDLAGWGGLWAATAKQYQLFPDAGTLVTTVQQIDATNYYYTADWSHVITGVEDPDFGGYQRTDFHIEGIATVVPVPAAVWLLGSGLVGLVGVARRRKAQA